MAAPPKTASRGVAAELAFLTPALKAPTQTHAEHHFATSQRLVRAEPHAHALQTGKTPRAPLAEQHAPHEGHQGGVWAVCPVIVTDRELLASAGHDGTVRIWDPATGERHALRGGLGKRPQLARTR